MQGKARRDGTPITKDELYLAIVQSYPTQTNETLNRLVNQILVENEAKKRKINVDNNETEKKAEELGITGDLAQPIKNMIKTSILIEKMIIKEKNINVSNNDIKKYFNEKKVELGEPEQVHIKQIFTKSESDAKDILLA